MYLEHPAPQARIHKAHAREPDRFTGKDPKKVSTFILQCIIFFQNDIDAYPNERIKINTAISYFEGLALDWVSPLILLRPTPAILTDWVSFTRGLTEMFGDRHVAVHAARYIDKLTMKDNQRAQRYIIEFAQHAPLTGYNEVALSNAFYNGLPDRLKDRICEVGRPTEFTALRALALNLDDRYWERQSELGSSSKTTTGSPPSNRDTTTKPQSSSTTSSQSKPASSNKPANDKPKIPGNQVTTSGKLTEEEKQRRRDRNLCMYCGSDAHLRPACPLVGPPEARKGTGYSKNQYVQHGYWFHKQYTCRSRRTHHSC